MPLPDADWLGLCRRAAHAARAEVAGLTSTAERSVPQGEGDRPVPPPPAPAVGHPVTAVPVLVSVVRSLTGSPIVASTLSCG